MSDDVLMVEDTEVTTSDDQRADKVVSGCWGAVSESNLC
jgi:hypothetical protein